MVMSYLLDNMSSYDGNVLLAAIVSLLLVILFVLLLHMYAKWFLAQAPPRRRRSRSSSMSVPPVLLPAPRFHHFHSFTTTIDTNNNTNISPDPSSKGLEASLIASIPLFVYTSAPSTSSRSDDDDDVYAINMQDGGEGFGLECVICLSGFEENGVGRCLPKCSHIFHVECIDMWLHYHSNCPVCRAPVVGGEIVADDSVMENNNNDHNHNHNHNHEIDEATGAGNVELLSDVAVEGEPRETERVVSEVSISSSTPDHVTSNCDHLLQVVGSITVGNHSASAVVAAASSPSSLGCSLNRMPSRQGSEHKVFLPS